MPLRIGSKMALRWLANWALTVSGKMKMEQAIATAEWKVIGIMSDRPI